MGLAHSAGPAPCQRQVDTEAAPGQATTSPLVSAILLPKSALDCLIQPTSCRSPARSSQILPKSSWSSPKVCQNPSTILQNFQKGVGREPLCGLNKGEKKQTQIIMNPLQNCYYKAHFSVPDDLFKKKKGERTVTNYYEYVTKLLLQGSFFCSKKYGEKNRHNLL